MLLMGGIGSTATYDYVKKIASMNLNVHLLICLGNNEQLAKDIRKISFNKSVSITIIPFTLRISDLMAVSDLLITKSGPGTINEGIYMELPMLVDCSRSMLAWENANLNLVVQNHLGDAVKSLDMLEGLLNKYINNKTYYALFKAALARHPKPDFNSIFKRTVAKMCPVN
jgi:processive 1,2-diacylglycerol beta-glucosyltransferase